MKAGYRTTEFWLTLLANVIGGAVAVGLVPSEGSIEKAIALLSMVLATYGYSASRSIVKSKK